MSILQIVQKGLALILCIAGWYVTRESSILGREAAFSYISGFKSFDPPEYLKLMENFIFSYQLAGGILLSIGLVYLLKGLDQK
ncbi:hypothetical protein EEL31_22375 [Brevibacillus laterosporus]|nr:hypothetical protein [Brevibacillus laterosporus]RAP27861.1 hypothetical protein C2W64_00680 [Brevibacillus laterosporus]TPG70918.1 hypothetical protein EEL31_22375 [Brevibacillus laterosporus]